MGTATSNIFEYQHVFDCEYVFRLGGTNFSYKLPGSLHFQLSRHVLLIGRPAQDMAQAFCYHQAVHDVYQPLCAQPLFHGIVVGFLFHCQLILLQSWSTKAQKEGRGKLEVVASICQASRSSLVLQIPHKLAIPTSPLRFGHLWCFESHIMLAPCVLQTRIQWNCTW